MRRGRPAALLQDLRAREGGREVGDLHDRRHLRRDVGLQLRIRATDFSCYKIPTAANAACPRGRDAAGLAALHRRPTACCATARRRRGRQLQGLGRAARPATASARRRTRRAPRTGAAPATRRGLAPPAGLLAGSPRPRRPPTRAARAIMNHRAAVLSPACRGSSRQAGCSLAALLASPAQQRRRSPRRSATCAATQPLPPRTRRAPARVRRGRSRELPPEPTLPLAAADPTPPAS